MYVINNISITCNTKLGTINLLKYDKFILTFKYDKFILTFRSVCLTTKTGGFVNPRYKLSDNVWMKVKSEQKLQGNPDKSVLIVLTLN